MTHTDAPNAARAAETHRALAHGHPRAKAMPMRIAIGSGIAAALMAWHALMIPALASALSGMFGGHAVLAAIAASILASGVALALLMPLAAPRARPTQQTRGGGSGEHDPAEHDPIHERLASQHDELQAMARRLITVQEDERRALSRELHDDVGQSITSIKLCALALLHEDDARRAETIAEIAQTADQTIAKLRDLSLLLRPPQLDALGLEAALRWQAGAMFRGRAPRLTLVLTPLPARPDADVELACFRIAQESLTNALRHADAREVTVALSAHDRELHLSVRDDGRGFDASQQHGLGLVTMRERAQLLGGRLEIDTDPDQGTCIRASLPLRSDA